MKEHIKINTRPVKSVRSKAPAKVDADRYMNSTGKGRTYDDKLVRQAYKLTLLGFTEGEIAKFFEVSIRMIHWWKDNRAEFRTAIVEGREYADANVVESMYKRATGYSYDDIHITVLKDGTVITTPITKHVIPDVTAGFRWLAARQKAKWGEIRQSENNIDVNINVGKEMSKFSNEQLEFMRDIGLASRAVPEDAKNN